ncbi:hypothetical protein MANES_16G042231v8 [Manihot esculenta]|uniref:Uncharacterized protein n=1 Tax=Manihot esculenta TaxID=3983 RepID=A0ACB7G5E0_MANES|nr:hypothetical protein MANES_16G042231v8 [Manihot esculenta]
MESSFPWLRCLDGRVSSLYFSFYMCSRWCCHCWIFCHNQKFSFWCKFSSSRCGDGSFCWCRNFFSRGSRWSVRWSC